MGKNDYKSFLSFVLPSVLAFALSGVYSIVDGFFIGRSLGDAGLASISLSFPLEAFIQAVGTGIGLAGAIRFTILQARQEARLQRECFSATALLMLLAGGLLMALLFFFAEPLLRLLGARGEILRLSIQYTSVIALGAVFQMLATGLVPFVRNMGSSTFAMLAMMLGFATNVILDFLFVWVLDWGMPGAAGATVLGQAVTMLTAILFFVRKRFALRLPPIAKLFSAWGRTLQVALSPFGLTFSPMITILLMNRFLLLYGDESTVAIFGCIGYVTSIIYLLLQGVGDGCQPLLSRHYGEKNHAALRKTLRLAYGMAFVISAACMVGVFLARGKVGVLFGASGSANAGVIQYLPYFLAPVLFLAFVRITTAYFYATEKNRFSYILVYAEPIFTLLLLLLLPWKLHLSGVWLAVPLAQTAAFVIALAEKKIAAKTAAES